MSQVDRELDQLFELFKDKKTKLFSVDQFIASLQSADLTQSTKILQERIAQLKKQQLTKQEVQQLFQNDIKNRDVSLAIFKSIQKKDQSHITVDDLILLNKSHNLGYSNDQLNFIMKYLGRQNQITSDQFVQLLQQQQN
ncbi:unnamed protein product (macronuclear) [Paramecium tetraurelia]|uniref:EF-hand domain-containing protein n=1 Tax=Paramecium tetraurelia TaxID=5888 RepID=A0C3B7_PARTE|nr:uncharacterized protein GSPATT00034763001 [Paramecium tetraurelia]CAK65284.1 unnamed protein product [Paramecium tetraurelia]|eukprot:XP_001432681.1 hypothetical protein (macronuclear) [Paramecium tetraurelia strain d4-2]